jgi:hypothetical protein
MDIPQLIQQYGYLAVGIVAFLEGLDGVPVVKVVVGAIRKR